MFWIELKSNPFCQLISVVVLLVIALIVDIVMSIKKLKSSGNFLVNLITTYPKSVMYVVLFPFVFTAITIYYGIKILWKMGRSFWVFLIERVLRPTFVFLVSRIIRPLCRFTWNKIIHPILTFVWRFIIKPVLQFLKFCWDQFIFPVVKFIGKILKVIYEKTKDIYIRSGRFISRFFKKYILPIIKFILKWVWKVIHFIFRCLWEVLVFVHKLVEPIYLFVWKYALFPFWKYVLVPISSPIWRFFIFLWDSIVVPLAELFLKIFDGIIAFIESWFG